MSDRISKTWLVLHSFESPEKDFCADVFRRPDGTYGFEEFRRDSEDMGKWTGIRYYSELSFDSKDDALEEADRCIKWLTHSIKQHNKGAH